MAGIGVEVEPGEDFKSFSIVIPYLPDSAAEADFHSYALERIRDCCGATACRGAIYWQSSRTIHGDGSRMIQGATNRCNSDECPLRGPDDSGDREPLIPTPPQPNYKQKFHCHIQNEIQL